MKTKFKYLSLFSLLVVLSFGIGAVNSANYDIYNIDDTIYIDDTTYSNDFDNNGDILSNSSINDGYTLNIGNLTNKNMNINKSLNIVGLADSTVNNGTIIIYANNSTIINLTIINYAQDSIRVYGASYIDIINNSIQIEGVADPNDPYSTVTGIYLEGNTDYVNIINNNININGSDAYSYGISNNIWIYSYVDPNNEFNIDHTLTNFNISDNTININTTGVYAGGIYSSTISNYIIADNDVFVSSNQFMYGIVVNDESTLTSSDLDAVTNVSIVNNNVTGIGYQATGNSTNGTMVYLIELFLTGNTIIEGNNLNGTGNGVYGVAVAGANNVNITNNNIEINGDINNLGQIGSNADYIPSGVSGVMLSYGIVGNSDNVLIDNNNFTIPDYESNQRMGIDDTYYDGVSLNDFVNNTLNGNPVNGEF